MEWIVVGVIIAAVAALLLFSALFSARPSAPPGYRLLSFLTPAERSFIGVLEQAVGSNRRVFAKVRVADVITPEKGLSRSDWQSAFNRISKKHFDYVLCDPNTLKVREVVELNDSSHKAPDRRKRDEFLRIACDSASLKLVTIKAARSYVVRDVREKIGGMEQ